jgi:hypothetical protein
LLKLRTENRYREAAKAIQTQLQSLHGTAQAVSILEEALAAKGGLRRHQVQSMTIA